LSISLDRLWKWNTWSY